MKIKNLNIVYFSGTNTTRNIIHSIAKGIDAEQKSDYDLTHVTTVRDINMDEDDLLLVGVPTYLGRVPRHIISSINRFWGNLTPAIIICTYGNRHYDDALLELKDMVSSNYFKVIAAATFPSQHSIFPILGEGRPNSDDLIAAENFGSHCMHIVNQITSIDKYKDIHIPGNYPYRDVRKAPIYPTGDKNCDECGICVSFCPRHAIYDNNPRQTDKKLCISCGKCISVCPQNARGYRGPLYKLAEIKFGKEYGSRKEVEMIYWEE